MVVHICNPSTQERQEHLRFKPSLGYIVKSCLRKTKNRGWRYGSNNKVPASQSQSPVVKPQYCQK
jgi:hypothetical protein